MKKLIALVLIAAFAVTSAAALTGCSAHTNLNAAGLPVKSPVSKVVTASAQNTDEDPAALTVAKDLSADDDTDDFEQTFTIAVQNLDTGETSSVIAGYADDRYDTVSGYFWLPAGDYDMAVYCYNAAGGNTSLCASGSCSINQVGDSGRAPVRINYYPVVSEVEALMQ